VIVSPWAKANFTSHTLYDHTSILATIQRKFNLPALTLRDANANGLDDCLVSAGPAPFLVPPALAAAPFQTEANSIACEQTGSPDPVVTPEGMPLGLAAGAAAVIAGGAAIRGRRSSRAQPTTTID